MAGVKTGEEWIDKYIGDNGLLSNIDRALNICDRLRETYPDDSHAQACEVWAVYEIEV